MKGDDKAAIEQKTQALAEASGKVAERAYAQQQSDAGAGGAEASAGESAEAGAQTGEAKDNVVDAEFEEVKEDNK